MDIATIIGLVAGTVLLGWAMLGSTDDAGVFLHARAAAIVLGGSAAAALVSFPMRKLMSVARVVKNCFFTRVRDPDDLIAELVRYAEIARRDGVLALESVTDDSSDPFVVAGLQMVVDGSGPDVVESILRSDLEAGEARHAEGKALFDNLARFAPAYGMIGTLIGLVVMLSNVSQPSRIGPAMAVALITTLYGALIANFLALPIAEKLAVRSREESLLKVITIKGVLAIQAGDSPRVVRQKLATFLPGRLRPVVREARAA